jgi:uncharacterized membrane protein YesL
MRFLLDSDSWFMQLISRFSSLVMLNLLFLCTCIPIFTIGAALTALYDVVFRMDTEREGKTISTYFRSFSANFRQSTPIWLLFLLFIAASCGNAVIFSGMAGTLGQILFVISVVILINLFLILGYVFPLLSQFDNTTGNTLKNALLLSAGNLPRTLLMAVINCFPWALLVLNLYAFIQLSFLWFALYFAAAAYFNSRVLMKVFQPLKESAST